MAHVHTPDMEAYAAEIRTIVLEELEEHVKPHIRCYVGEGESDAEIVPYAMRLLQEKMDTRIFYLVKSRGLVTPSYHYRYQPTTGLYRRREDPVEYSDIPRSMRDLGTLVPDLDAILLQAVLEVRKDLLTDTIREVTEAAAGNEEQ